MSKSKIVEQAEPIIELLISQCGDLESLLLLAKRETAAAETGDFEEILNVVEERATLGQKLETFQRQIESLRESMGYKLDIMLKNSITERAAFLINQIQSQDEITRPLLVTSRNNASENLQQLSRSQMSINAYLKDQSKTSVACDTVL